MNQYWYSTHTIETIAAEVDELGGKVAFLSTPSIYFSLPRDSAVRKSSYVFDLDEAFGKDANFVMYNYNRPEDFPEELRNSFDVVVIDPPFITQEVWALYSKSAQALLKEGGKAILTTISENAPFLREMFGVEPQRFKPSIPHLVYQYALYTNYPSTRFSEPNPEVPED